MYAEPHCYDLCEVHSARLTAPIGWEVVRLAPDAEGSTPSADDLEALANAVREAARPAPRPHTSAGESAAESAMEEIGRRGHLRVLRDPEA
jgi:hypothetical protein